MATSARPVTARPAVPGIYTQREIIRLDEMLSSHAQERWSEKVVQDGRNRAAMICSPAGTPGDPHLHPDFNEWWVILNDEVEYAIGEYEPFTAKFGSIVIAPCGYRHDIRPIKGDRCLRMVVGLQHSNHDLKGVEPARQVPLDEIAPPNRIHTSLEYMLARHGTDNAWSEQVLFDQRNRANMIHQLPGQANRPHWHPDMDEWWVVFKGELEWQVGKDAPFRAKRGDIVFVKAGRAHSIKTVGEESSIRLAVTTPDVVHYFLDDPSAPRPPRD
jgi:quercetin dioxygenase-like cupin family protein